jgi:hypothetical protein
MRRVILLAGVALVAATAAAPGQVIIYNNTTNSSTNAVINGGATSQAAITQYIADDIQPITGFAGRSVTNFTLSVANLNTTAVTARPRVKFFLPDGPNLGPGTALATLNFPATPFTASSISLIVSGPLAPGTLVIPPGFFWAGVVFDDNLGTTGATAAQLNNLGQGQFNPPTVGISDDVYFRSTAAGVPGNFPAGQQLNFGGPPNPVANFGWQFQVAPVPEPGTLVLCFGPTAVALLGYARRFQSRKQKASGVA